MYVALRTLKGWDLCGCLPAHPSTVDGENMTVEVIARGRRKEDCGSGEIFRLTPPTCGNTFEDLPVAGLVGLKRGGVGGSHVPRSDGVHIDVVFRPLIGQRFCQLCHATL